MVTIRHPSRNRSSKSKKQTKMKREDFSHSTIVVSIYVLKMGYLFAKAKLVMEDSCKFGTAKLTTKGIAF